MPTAPPHWKSPAVNENITDCLAGPGRNLIISQLYQPNLLPAPPTSVSPTLSPATVSPPCIIYNASLSPLWPSTCLNVSQTYSALRLYIRWASSIFPIPHQLPFTCLPFSHPSTGFFIPRLTKSAPIQASICPKFVFLQTHFLVSIHSLPTSPLTCHFLAGSVLIPLSPQYLSLSPPLSPLHSSAFSVAGLGALSIFPWLPRLGRLPSPSECSLGDMKPCQLPMSLLEHNVVRQADADTHTNTHEHTKHISPLLHGHTSECSKQATHQSLMINWHYLITTVFKKNQLQFQIAFVFI